VPLWRKTGHAGGSEPGVGVHSTRRKGMGLRLSSRFGEEPARPVSLRLIKMKDQARYPCSLLKDSVRPVATFLQTEEITSQESKGGLTPL